MPVYKSVGPNQPRALCASKAAGLKKMTGQQWLIAKGLIILKAKKLTSKKVQWIDADQEGQITGQQSKKV